MAIQEYILDDEAVSYLEYVPATPDRNDRGIYAKSLSDGLNGKPQVNLAIHTEGIVEAPHFHDASQFQVILEGSVRLPNRELEAIGVNYQDANTPYGPLHQETRFHIAVVRLQKAGITQMSDREGRKLRNPYGRELTGQTKDVPWEELADGVSGVRRKVLFGREGEEGPKAHLWECAPNLIVPRDAAPFGEYHILLRGSARLGNQDIKPYSMRFVKGDDSPTPITSGAEGATWLILTFDQAS